MRVAFAGTPDFALPALAALAAHHEIVGVLTQPDRPQGRGRHLGASPVKVAALARGFTLDQPLTLRDAAGRAALAAWAPDVLVVVAYGLLLPPAVLTLPRHGCLNIHASLLPRWRGAAPIQRAILAGDAESGVSIMQMDAGLDTGAVLLERRHALAPRETGGSLHDALAALGAEAIVAALAQVAQGTARARAQSAAGVTYAAKLAKAEARIDWSEDAAAIDRKVRAFNPWPVAETRLSGEQLRIFRAAPLPDTFVTEIDPKSAQMGSIVAVHDDFFAVRCGSGLLGVQEVQQPGRKPVPARDFSHAHRLLGVQLG
ncbi:MAG: methionyl-tRNA formyltransferase [Proteobacteria bacterium]|nr:methionyl-tRNA formyltransferase [Pseudomonadota bacterium]